MSHSHREDSACDQCPLFHNSKTSCETLSRPSRPSSPQTVPRAIYAGCGCWCTNSGLVFQADSGQDVGLAICCIGKADYSGVGPMIVAKASINSLHSRRESRRSRSEVWLSYHYVLSSAP